MYLRRWWWALLGILLLVWGLSGCQPETKPSEQTLAPAGPGSCAECHADTTIIAARRLQVAASAHADAANLRRNSAACAICHTSQGFTIHLAKGTTDIGKDIEDPAPIGCQTCHKIHTHYTAEDYGLRVEGPLKIELTGDVVDMGRSNLCGQCHQPGWGYPPPVPGGPDVEIGSRFWGPHYGPQAAVVAGVGGYGSFGSTSVHYTFAPEGCVTCHMARPYGTEAGGHTMGMRYTEAGHSMPNVSGCNKCHAGIESFNQNNIQADVTALLEELRSLLLEAGLLDSNNQAVPGTYSADEAGALWNYLLITHDGSLGVHNPAFTREMLNRAIAALEKK